MSRSDLHKFSGLAQKELSEWADIANSSLRTLQRLAAGMGMRLKLEFVPETKQASL